MAAADTTHRSREIARIESGAEWYGYLTLNNLDAVAVRLTALIGGGRRFTSVYTNEDFWAWRPPEVRTGQTATVKVTRSADVTHPYITISETGWTSWLEASVADQGAARTLADTRRPPHLRFKHDRVEITDHAPAGNKFYIVFAVERPEQ